jgi:hypothetical protein
MTTATETKTFLNTKFTKRDYECSNVVACQAETAPGPQWVECDESIIANLQKLWITDGVRYFGWL